MIYHRPVLLHDCIEGLSIKPTGIFVDVTFGGGGHSKEILKKLTSGKLYAFDQDEDAMKNNIEDDRFLLINANFTFLKNYLKMHRVDIVDGILADLGVSSFQFDEAEKGFSTRFDGNLDMRMDKRSSINAEEIINTKSESELKLIFQEYGEVINSGKLASIIVTERIKQPITTIAQFKNAISFCTPKGKENKYLAQVFQALRIVVNDEINALKKMLIQSLEVLKSGGRLVVMSYHSLEDRIVKNFMKSGNFEGVIEKDFYGNPLVPFRLINRKPIVPAMQEIESNNRSRSAKLRIAEKI